MATTSPSSSVACTVLTKWGARISPIRTTSKEEADWIASLDGERLLIEEKEKIEDPSTGNDRESILRSGSVYGLNTALGYNNRVAGIVSKATKQLESSGAQQPHDFRLLWLTATGFDAEARQRQTLSTLYGSTSIFDVDRQSKKMRQCYFFRNSELFRHKDILHGAVVAYLMDETLTMFFCLNPLSSDYQKLKASALARRFPNGLIDPISEEAAGEAYLVVGDVDRRDEAAVHGYLQSKYNLGHTQNMDFNLMSGTVLMRNHTDTD